MRITLTFILCSLLVVLTGCLKVNQAMTLNSDGSGVIEIKYAVSNQALRQLDAMRRLQNQLALASGKPVEDDEEIRYAYLFLMPDSERLREELERYKNLGIQIEKLKVSTGGVWRNVEIKLLFNSLKQLAKVEPFKYIGFDLVKNADGNYVFYHDSTPREGYTPPDFNDPVVAKLLTPIFAGFTVKFALKTPGRVLRTNAPRKSTYVSEWLYAFDQDPSVIAKIQTAKRVTIFDSTGLNLPEIRH